MDEHRLRLALARAGHDFSADICPEATLNDLEPQAIDEFRKRWNDKSGRISLADHSHEPLLRDEKVILEEGVTYAALILFGTRQALGRLLGQAEVAFEYRSSDASGPAQERNEYRQGFFSVRSRDKKQPIQPAWPALPRKAQPAFVG